MIVDTVLDGTLVRTAVLDPAAPARETWFAALGFAAWLDEAELARFSWLASAWQRRLVVVETPGTGGPTHLTVAESKALLWGDFGPLADRFLAAAREAAGEIPLTGSLGYSMGASVATAASRRAAATGGPLASIVLVEPIAVRRWRPLGLALANRSQERLNRASGMPVGSPPPPRVRRSDQILMLNALRHGRIPADLDAIPPVRLVAARGLDSPMCDAAGLARLARRAKAAGHHVDVLEIPGSHTIWHRQDAVATIAREVSRALDC